MLEKEILRNTLKLRWIHAACYEIKLPNGRTILIDPFITPLNFENFSRDDVEGADYILISHTHFDHITDVGYLQQKFGGKVVVGDRSALPLKLAFDLPHGCVYAVKSGDEIYFEDFKLTVLWGRHGTAPFPGPFPTAPKGEKVMGVPSEYMAELNEKGSLQMLSFLITLKDNTRILITSGNQEEAETNLADAKKYAPNILIRKFQNDARTFAEYAAATGAQLAMMHHHERFSDGECDKAVAEVNERLAALGSRTVMINPGKFRWYSVQMNVIPE